MGTCAALWRETGETEMIEANIINEQFAQTLAARTDERCGFCYPREHGKNGEVRREWSPTWNMFINFCRKHSPEQECKSRYTIQQKRAIQEEMRIVEANKK
jgi:hypothetical protein